MQIQSVALPLASSRSRPSEPEPEPGLSGKDLVDAGVRGGIAYGIGIGYPSVWLHEMGHAVTASALYQGANPRIEVTPWQGGVTYWRPGPLTELGQELGPTYARAAVSAAGTVVDVGLATTTFAAGYMMRHKRPVLGSVLMGYAGFTMVNTVAYALSALGTARAGNDFATIATMTGIHPLITAGVLAAILPAEYLLLRHLEKKGIL
ncbi:hypothetical protein DYH09_15370 [bacterium CPR1]|nr:hypothetical protein [bacterium CPR1]